MLIGPVGTCNRPGGPDLRYFANLRVAVSLIAMRYRCSDNLSEVHAGERATRN